MTTVEQLSTEVLDDLDWWVCPVTERDPLFAWLRADGPRPFAELGLKGSAHGSKHLRVTVTSAPKAVAA